MYTRRLLVSCKASAQSSIRKHLTQPSSVVHMREYNGRLRASTRKISTRFLIPNFSLGISRMREQIIPGPFSPRKKWRLVQRCSGRAQHKVSVRDRSHITSRGAFTLRVPATELALLHIHRDIPVDIVYIRSTRRHFG